MNKEISDQLIQDIKVILNFVERYNKNDEELDVAEAANNLHSYVYPRVKLILESK